MKSVSALEVSNKFWAASPLIVIDAKAGLLEVPNIDALKAVALWHGEVMTFGRSNDSKSLSHRAVASIGAIDDSIIMEVYDYDA